MENKIVIQSANDRVLIQTQELHDEYIAPGFHYELKSTQAIIDLVKARGSQENTFVFYDDDESKPRIYVILDDTVEKRKQCTAGYNFEFSDLFTEWKGIMGHPIGQKPFFDFLKRRDALVEFPEVQALQIAVKQLSLATIINYDAMIEDDNNYSVAFKIKDMEGSTKLPTDFEIHIPLLNESDKTSDINIELAITKPTGDGPIKADFLLTWPLLHRYIKEAVTHEINKVKEALAGYYILAGDPRS